MDVIYLGALCLFAACPVLLLVACGRLGGDA